jgi:hypothetical protein
VGGENPEMKVKSVSAKIEKIIYEFDERDIKDALLKFIRFEKKAGQEVKVDWNQFFDYPVEVTITISNEAEEENETSRRD